MRRTYVLVMLMSVVGQCLSTSVSDDNGTCEILNKCQTVSTNKVTKPIVGEPWPLPKKIAEANKSGNESVAVGIPTRSKSLFVLDNRIPVETNGSVYENGK